MYILTILIFSISLPLLAQVQRPKALVYGGIGACNEDCVTGAMEAAQRAGLEPTVVYPETFNDADLVGARVWIQPGGFASQAAKAMGPKMLSKIREFVKKGGGYVGFCAGAFLATTMIGETTNHGLGILPGNSITLEVSKEISLEKMRMRYSDGSHHTRQIYWEGGPFFVFTKLMRKKVSVRGTYTRTNQIGAVRTNFYKGRVFVSGAHPEAPKWWSSSENLIDKDGEDYAVTTDMILWASRIKLAQKGKDSL